MTPALLPLFIAGPSASLRALTLAATGEAVPSQTSLTLRIAAAAVTAFLLVLLCGPTVIRQLQRRFRERIDSASARLNELHAAKQNTPTMGGLLLVAAILAATLLFGDLTQPYVQIALFVTLSFSLLGATDDWIKLSTSRRGLTARQKFAIQTLLATAAATWLHSVSPSSPDGPVLHCPWGQAHVILGAAFIPWGAFVMVASSNGVNLTDGLDGLASGCIIFAGTAFVALTYLAGHATFADHLTIPFQSGSGELSIVMAAMVGAVLGFLWFNCHPAQVFMGDTGSLPLGALLAFAALVSRQELLLIVVGGVFVIETLSVILQIACYKLVRRKPLACSPLHNHFVFRGHHENKIVTRFWIAGALLAILGVGSLTLK